MHTVTSMANRFAVDRSRVEYVIRSRAIQPSGRAGNCRIFNDAAKDEIRRTLNGIVLKREAMSCN